MADSDVVRRLSDEVFMGGNIAPLDELIDDRFLSHDPPPGMPGTKEGMRQIAEVVIAAFSNRKFEFDDYLDITDGRVIENWAMSGTHSGEAFGLPPSGQEIRVRGL